MVVLYDSFFAILYFAMLSFTVTLLRYYRRDDGYDIGEDAPTWAMAWLGFMPVMMYRVFSIYFEDSLGLAAGIALIAGCMAYLYYSRFVKINRNVSKGVFFRNLSIVSVLVMAFIFSGIDAYLLKTGMLILALLAGVVLLVVQKFLHKNKIDLIWILFLVLGEFVLVSSMYVEVAGRNDALVLHQFIGIILFIMGLAVNFYDASVLTSNKKIEELEKQNRRLFEAEVQVLKYAYKDQITNLPNYSSFFSTLSSILNSNTTKKLHLLYLDLDDFRRVNTVVGFAEGNEILRACGDVITGVIPSKDKLFRINGSRFALIHFGDLGSARQLAREIIKVVNDEEKLRTNSYFRQGISIGISEVDCKKDFNTIVNQAEIAMYKVKEFRKNDYEYFNELHEKEYKKLLELEGKLKNATEENVWSVYLQPQVSVENNEILGLEALIRWFDGDRYIPPVEFIPLAEKNGLIINIGDDVIQKVFALMSDCRHKYNCPLRFSINVSAVEIFDVTFVKRIQSYIDKYDVDPRNVTLELTETSILDNLNQAVAILTELREMNLSISIDDFGSGYTSLYYLSKLPIDEVKIDKSFIDNILSNEKDRIMLGHFTNLCHDLGLNVVAEGVETKEQLEYVRSIGCDLYQGYFFSKPMSYEQICSTFNDRARIKTS